LQPIVYESRKLHPPERNYPIHDKEMLAIVHAFKVWRCYLTGADMTVRTDHRSLQIPSAIILDRDMKFTSNFCRNLWEQFGTRLQFSSAYHLETGGQTERANHTMEQPIRVTCDDVADWEQQVPLIEFVYNNAPSATIRQSPFYLNYGQNPT
ncbi:hypothetical protein CLOP_g19060, partial [Closterium sp. NIES-67]